MFPRQWSLFLFFFSIYPASNMAQRCESIQFLLNSIQNYQMLFLLLLSILTEVSGKCVSAQKSLFLSFRSLASREHMERLFDSVSQQTATYNLSYTEPAQGKSYQITALRYRLSYNCHFQQQTFLDEQSVRVRLGRIDLLSVMNYSIKDSQSQVLFSGRLSGFSTLDPSSFEKQLALKDGSVQWSLKTQELLTFSGLWTLQSNLYLPDEEHYVLLKIINNIVPTSDVRALINSQINILFASNLLLFLNSDYLFSTNQIPYHFKNISLPLTHNVSSISVSNSSSGVIAFIDFGIRDADQTNCTAIPTFFSEASFGGIQELVSITTINLIFQQAVIRGLFDVSLDESWESDVFQLFMGDLANAVSQADYQAAITPISIQCKPSDPSKAKSFPFDESRLYIQLPQSCLVQIKEESLIRVDLFLVILIKISAEKDYLSVMTQKVYSRSTKYTAVKPNFRVTNPEVARMVEESLLRRMVGVAAFGTRIPLIQKKSPAVILMADYLLIFDSSELLRLDASQQLRAPSLDHKMERKRYLA